MTDNLARRLKQHQNGNTKSTKYFGNFKHIVLEDNITTAEQARLREKYWKSCAGRKKLKNYLIKYGPIV